MDPCVLLFVIGSIVPYFFVLFAMWKSVSISSLAMPKPSSVIVSSFFSVSRKIETLLAAASYEFLINSFRAIILDGIFSDNSVIIFPFTRIFDSTSNLLKINISMLFILAFIYFL